MKKAKSGFVKNVRYLCLIGVITLGLIAIVGSNGGDEDNGETTIMPDNVNLILNGPDLDSMSTYWHIDLGSTSGTGDWAFFEDGTGIFRRGIIVAGAWTTASFTWTKIGPAALLADGENLPYTNFREIDGSISEGSFTAKLDTNETRRTFALQSGSF